MTPTVEAFAESFAELLSTTANLCYMTTAGELQEATCHRLSQAREAALAHWDDPPRRQAVVSTRVIEIGTIQTQETVVITAL